MLVSGASACESNFSAGFISSSTPGAIQVYDTFCFGVDRVSSFLSVIHCVRTLEFYLERETAENHKTNIHWSIWNRISYNIALSEKNIYYKGSLKRQQLPVSEGKKFWSERNTCFFLCHQPAIWPWIGYLNLFFMLCFWLSCQVRLCSLQGRARVLCCDSGKPSAGIIWPWIKVCRCCSNMNEEQSVSR